MKENDGPSNAWQLIKRNPLRSCSSVSFFRQIERAIPRSDDKSPRNPLSRTDTWQFVSHRDSFLNIKVFPGNSGKTAKSTMRMYRRNKVAFLTYFPERREQNSPVLLSFFFRRSDLRFATCSCIFLLLTFFPSQSRRSVSAYIDIFCSSRRNQRRSRKSGLGKKERGVGRFRDAGKDATFVSRVS